MANTVEGTEIIPTRTPARTAAGCHHGAFHPGGRDVDVLPQEVDHQRPDADDDVAADDDDRDQTGMNPTADRATNDVTTSSLSANGSRYC
jgi:hypothetical protein